MQHKIVKPVWAWNAMSACPAPRRFMVVKWFDIDVGLISEWA